MKEKKTIDRREFLKVLGVGAVASTAALYGCRTRGSAQTEAVGEVPTDKMTFRTTPATGDRVSLLGYGCMRWPEVRKADGQGKEIDQEAVNELVDYAIAHGVNYFDTAPVYLQGKSEQATGIALKRHPRDKFFIATKMSNFRNPTRENSIAMYRASFTELQVDCIDYYLLHSLGEIDNFRERFIDNGILDFLLREREAGRIRNLGWSFHGSRELFDYMLAMDVKWDFVQIQHNYVDWKHASGRNIDSEYLYTQLAEHNVAAVVMEPLLGGRLAKLPDHLTTLLKERRPQATTASWAFRFAGTHPGILTVLSGMTYMEHLQDNIRTYSPLEELSEEEFALLENTAQLLLQYPIVPCTDCKYCMPCPYGLDIPGIFAHYNRCVNEGSVPKDRQSENYRRARRAFLVGYDRSVPEERQASRCIGCDQCVKECPQKIRIPQEMQRIDAFVEQFKRETV